jgi:hypothetical protein
MLINEILYDPTGADLGFEWIELLNNSEEEVNLNGWEIQVAGTTFKNALTIPLDMIVQPSEYVVICEEEVECDFVVSKLGFQNGGSSSDGIHLLDPGGTIIDSVIYDSPNTNSLTNELGVIVTSPAPSVESGESLGRRLDMDSDDNSFDFIAFELPTPGTTNIFSEVVAEKEEILGEKEILRETGADVLPIFLFALILIFFLSINFVSFENGSKEEDE